METEMEMELSDGENINANKTGLNTVYGNSEIGLGREIERRQEDNEEQLPGYIFMCNGKTKLDCFIYRVFGIPKGRIHVVESIKPGMKLFLYDFEKRLLYGVYEATIGGMLNIEPEAFDRKYPAQVGFRIVKNCYPLPESSFKPAILENYKGVKFKQEITPHQVMSLLSLFRTFTAPELDSLPQRLASKALEPSRGLSFEERFIAATQLKNASSVLDPLSGRYAEQRLGSHMAHQSVPRTPMLQHGYSRQDEYETPGRGALNQPYFPTESRQQRLSGDPSRSSIQDPQLKYLTILSNIRRYGTASEHVASESEYYPETPSEKNQFASPYSDNKYYQSTLSETEHPSASNGSVYRSEFYTSASQIEGEGSQQHEVPGVTYYHPEASTVPNNAVSMQSEMQPVSVSQSHTETTPQPAAGAIGYTHQPQTVAGSYTAHSQPGSTEESTQSYAGVVSHPQQQYYAVYADGTGYIQQPHETGYAPELYAAPTGYAQQPDAAASGYAQQLHAAATAYAQQPHAASTAYAQQHYAGYAQQPQATATGYAQQPYGTSTGYAQQPYTQAVEYTMQPHAQAVGYTLQYQAQAGAYTQQPVTQSSVTGTTDWSAASKAYADWNAANQSYYPQTADATTTYNQTSKHG